MAGKNRVHPTREETASALMWTDSYAGDDGKRFVPGTEPIRYGEGDWNDSLPAGRTPIMRDWMRQ